VVPGISSNTPQKTFFAITIDVDPDVNLPLKGQASAISHPVEKGETRFESCAIGLEAILNSLNELCIPATFFMEARTAETLNSEFGLDLVMMFKGHEIGFHGHMHEDFLGIGTGMPLKKNQMTDTLKTGLKIMDDLFDRRINGFRAPYIRINDTLAQVLVELGIKYDSSVTRRMPIMTNAKDDQAEPFQPFYYFEDAETNVADLKALIEVPIPDFIFPDGNKLTSYLWPFIEGDIPFRKYREALDLIVKMKPNNSLIPLSTHPWHLVETYKHGLLDEKEQLRILNEYSSILSRLSSNSNIEFIRVSDYIDRFKLLE
jgi:peptidoglycan/xylan/chitin deacetylase (PgdA/CDA1 family)